MGKRSGDNFRFAKTTQKRMGTISFHWGEYRGDDFRLEKTTWGQFRGRNELILLKAKRTLGREPTLASRESATPSQTSLVRILGGMGFWYVSIRVACPQFDDTTLTESARVWQAKIKKLYAAGSAPDGA